MSAVRGDNASVAPEARRWVRALHALGGGFELRKKAAARALLAAEPDRAPALIAAVIELSASGDEAARCVLRDLLAALEDGEGLPGGEVLRELSRASGQRVTESLFPAPAAQREMVAEAAARSDALKLTGTLGHMKTMARLTRDPDQLSRLTTVSNPAVIRNALLNPRLTEDRVVRMAARRPARPEPLAEIWRSAKWSARPAVRRALVLNPYLPVEIGSRIVPLLLRPEIEEVAAASWLHPSIRELARRLLDGGGPG